MRGLLIVVALHLAAPAASAQDSFRLPDNLRGSVVDHLARLKVRDTSRALGKEERRGLCRLFVKAYATAVRSGGQGLFLSTGVPVYGLLAANFPEVRARESEGGALINLGEVVNFFNSLPEYRREVVSVLRAGVNEKHCRRQ